MTARAVISTIGPDRPGLVHNLTSLVHDHGLSVEDSRMAALGGEFAILISIAGDAGALSRFRDALDGFATDQGLAHLFRETARSQPRSARPYRVTVSALDHPGIVRRVAEFFSTRNINIRDLHTEVSPAPHTGTPIFKLTIVIDLPQDARIGDLRRTFEDFCDQANLDGEMDAVA